MKPIQIHPLSALAGIVAFGLISMGQSSPRPTSHGLGSLSPLEDVLSNMSVVYLDDGQGGTVKTILFSGVNVQIVNGLGATNGRPDNPDSINPLFTQTNGTGNLIVGYNEPGHPAGDNRTGSHNIVAGIYNSWRAHNAQDRPRLSTR